MTPGDLLVFASQQREDEGGEGIADSPSSFGPSDFQEPVTPSNGERVSTDLSLGSPSSPNDIGSSHHLQLGFERHFLFFRFKRYNPSNAYAISFSERMSSEAGNESEIEQFEDVKIGLQRPPQFGKEAQVLCITGPHDILTMEFHVVPANFDKISLWIGAPENVQ